MPPRPFQEILSLVIDLDANATTRLAPEVLESMLPWLIEKHGNPSAHHRMGREARKAIETAREQVASLIHAKPEEIVFTSGGTESVNAALCSLHHLTKAGPVVTSAIEHSAVLKTCAAFPREHVLLPVTHHGQVDLEHAAVSMKKASFISVMWANNETGVIQPIEAVAQLADEYGIPVHSDAVQVAGKIPVDVRNLPIDLLSLSAHKFHGPKGIGALYIRSGIRFHPLLMGGGQENGRRSGTENTAAIVGMGKAAELASAFLAQQGPADIALLRNHWEHQIMSLIEGVTQNGHSTDRLCNTSHLSFQGCDAAGLLILLDQAGIACSAGSACMSGKQSPSHVQLAMGIPESTAKSSIRFSLSRYTNTNEIQQAAAEVAKAVHKLRSIQSTGTGPVTVYSPV